MNPKENLIIAKNEIRTEEIKRCQYSKDTGKYHVEFYKGKEYTYSFDNIVWLKNPKRVDPKQYHIYHNGKRLDNIQEIYVFQAENEAYWHICFRNGRELDYQRKNLQVVMSCLLNKKSKSTFDYLKRIAALSEIKSDEGESLLIKQYEKIDFVDDDLALSLYLNPHKKQTVINKHVTPIFPFGCNQSQYKAVRTALENSFSVIQGPPGTGKTQTILNIIANILSEGKTVIVVSNNNTATENILDKLKAPRYGMDFIVAPLGKEDNKKAFIEGQTGSYPDIADWEKSRNGLDLLWNIKQKSQELKILFEKQERLALLKQEISIIELEQKYFEQYMQNNKLYMHKIRTWKRIRSYTLLLLWQEYQEIADQEMKLNLFTRLKSILYYGILDKEFYRRQVSQNISEIQNFYYHVKIDELEREKNDLEHELSELLIQNSLEKIIDQSMQYLRQILYEKYGDKKERKVFTSDELWKTPEELIKEYPVVLSTTFSARKSLGNKIVYDYLIMDEASQVDIATGALALSCAKNVVIVGDTKQLPNVVTDNIQKQASAIFKSFQLSEGYQFTKSFLQSVLDVIPDIPQTLLKEHYRCHPKIINFCNQKFYNGELVIMTQDKGEKDVLSVIKTVVGNHDRSHYNQREIDVIEKEVLPQILFPREEIGIIAPYKKQVVAMDKEIMDIEHDTVHKYQGREKEVVILSTVDNVITDFVDNPSLINVAISRAKKQFCLVVSGNQQPRDSNIGDLISYIEYNNFEIRESKVYSVFDYLYKQYAASRKEYLKKHKRISEYDSENLMYAAIEEVLEEDAFSVLEIAPHYLLSALIKDKSLLNEEECVYVENSGSHIDFLLSNRVSKEAVLAIEVDGWQYHKEGTEQAKRDKMKNYILEKYGIDLIRFVTNGSGEKERLRVELKRLLKQ